MTARHILLLLVLIPVALVQAQTLPDFTYGICYFSEPERFHFGSCLLENLPDNQNYVNRFRVVFQPEQELAFLPEVKPNLTDQQGILRTGAFNHRDLGGIWYIGSPDWGFITLVPMDPSAKEMFVQQHGVEEQNVVHYQVSPMTYQDETVKGVYYLEVGEDRNPQPGLSIWKQLRPRAQQGWEKKFYEFLHQGQP